MQNCLTQDMTIRLHAPHSPVWSHRAVGLWIVRPMIFMVSSWRFNLLVEKFCAYLAQKVRCKFSVCQDSS